MSKEKTEPSKKIINPADMPPEVYEYYHKRWAEYLSKHYKTFFVQNGLAGLSFTEKAPDIPDGSGKFTYSFSADGTLKFTEEEGDSIIEYDSYNIGYRAFGDENFNVGKAIEEGKFRFTKNQELFMKLAAVLPVLREGLKAAIADTEKKFNTELPKYW